MPHPCIGALAPGVCLLVPSHDQPIRRFVSTPSPFAPPQSCPHSPQARQFVQPPDTPSANKAPPQSKYSPSQTAENPWPSPHAQQPPESNYPTPSAQTSDAHRSSE